MKRHGGRVEGEKLLVKPQAPKPPKLELWDDYGSPVERIGTADPRWRFQGPWQTRSDKRRGGALQVDTRIASGKGAEATITFDGAGAVMTGPCLPTGGKADVYLDGKLDRTVDVYPDEDRPKTGEAVWHAYGLKRGKHTVRMVVRGESFGDSKGSDIALEDLIVFR